MASFTSRASGFWNEVSTTSKPYRATTTNSNNRSSVFSSHHGEMAHSDSAEDYFRVGEGRYESPDEDDDDKAQEDDDDGDDEDEGQKARLLGGDEDEWDGRTPLDKTIDKIGMGSYQWTLLSLCGLGWMADNMWIQAVAIILPRVQRHYDVPDSYIGTVSSSMFAGMMLGAVGWGTCSDLMGRITAFNATLFFTALFGILASLSNSFFTLCLTLFFLGSSVGGSMPTDGTLLLEHMPKSKQYLVTALSVFFSFGAVLSAIIALLVIPQHSCLPSSTSCDPAKDNMGWKYLLITLALLTLFMFVARMVFFRLHESPRYLVHAGRPQDAVKSLQLISRFNGADLLVELDDVRDHHHPQEVEAAAGEDEQQARPRATSRTIFDATMVDDGRTSTRVSVEGAEGEGGTPPRPPLVTAYASTGETPSLESTRTSAEGNKAAVGGLAVETNGNGNGEIPNRHSFYPPTPTSSGFAVDVHTILGQEAHHRATDATTTPAPSSSSSLPAPPRPPAPNRRPTKSKSKNRRRTASGSRRRASVYEQKVCWALPRWVRRPLWAWWDRVAMVLSPEWRRTTLLVWAVWWGMSLAYTMFNVFLPKLLETSGVEDVVLGAGARRQGEEGGVPGPPAGKTLEQSLWDVVIFTIGGCPGAILGAWLIESKLGRRWSLAGSTFVTAFWCVVFAMVKQEWAVRASTVGISLSATAMWAVLYGWTPEIFGTKVRGSACGIASALSRIGGMIAPILGGVLLMMSRTIPVYTSVVVFVLSGICVLFLKEAPRQKGRGGGGGGLMH